VKDFLNKKKLIIKIFFILHRQLKKDGKSEWERERMRENENVDW
jgi:hypothetical protein